MSSTGDFVRVGNDAFSVDVLEMVDMFIPMDHWLVIKDGKVRDPKRGIFAWTHVMSSLVRTYITAPPA
jgi:hypothetical protein